MTCLEVFGAIWLVLFIVFVLCLRNLAHADEESERIFGKEQ